MTQMTAMSKPAPRQVDTNARPQAVNKEKSETHFLKYNKAKQLPNMDEPDTTTSCYPDSPVLRNTNS
jgi:hypothetical protein